MSNKGTLFLVSTPIGNLEDITLRALRVLKEVDIIAAEDTRRTVKLLNHFQIKTSLTSYYEHNKIQKGDLLIKKLLKGENIALVSDAGSPGISDPGEDIVKLAIQNDIDVTVVPGAVAAIAALVLSGMSTSKFVFEGFLPVAKKARNERISSLNNETRTIVIYEAPHKLPGTLKNLYDILGNRKIGIARELTKIHEQLIRCYLKEAVEKYTSEKPRGEFVLIIEGVDPQKLQNQIKNIWGGISVQQHVNIYLNQGMCKKDSIKRAAKDRHMNKRDVYRILLNNKNDEKDD